MKVIAIMPRKKYDYTAHAVIEGLQQLGIELICTDRMDGTKVTIYSEEDVLRHAKTADYIFAVWGKDMGKFHLLDQINRPERTIYIDGSEWTYTGHPNPKPGQAHEAKLDYSRRRGEPWINKEMLTKAKWYFKRECYQQDIDEFGCIPFPFAILNDYYTNKTNSRDIDIFCAFGHVDTGLREEVENVCNELGKEGFNAIVGRRFSREKYIDFMNRSLISVDALGGGDCNARRWEILASKSCLFSEQYNIIIPHDFTENVNIVNYKTVAEFKQKARHYIRDRENTLQIGQNGHEHGIKYHTSIKRMEYLLNIVEKG
jgi:hypothetical protein